MSSSLPYAQRTRLTFIDFSLEFYGHVARADLIQQFGTGLAAATRDLAAYRELAPDNLTLCHQTKLYYRTEQFTPLFSHSAEIALERLIHGFGDKTHHEPPEQAFCLDAIRLVHPKPYVIATLSRAIRAQQALLVRYVSLSSGATERELIPHALVNNGHRWHVRAFDRKSGEFRDFVCTRFLNLTPLAQANPEHKAKPNELRKQDNQWNRIVELELIPHPKLQHSQAIEMDYDMQDGICPLEVRAAVAGYLLQQWSVDCSADHSLTGAQYQLALRNHATLYGVQNLLLAPGYRPKHPAATGGPA